jgi:polyhydroxybutyrate depolymerase
MRIIVTPFILFMLSSIANANLRDRIKERLIERQKEKPAPAAELAPDIIKAPGDYTFSAVVTGQTRYYKVHVPKNYSADRPTALLVALHGGGGDMSIQATEEYYHQISKSDSDGYVAIFPNGFSPFPSGKFATWNAGRCCGKARDSNIDDVAFIKQIVTKTRAQLSIDARRIYASGMSNGAMMAYRLACEAPETFRAIAAVAGTDNTANCKPVKPVSVLHVHAKDDDHVLFNGGAGKKAFRDQSSVTDFSSVASTIEKWRLINACGKAPKRNLEIKGAYCDLYEACAGGSRVQLCVTETGGHSWPGGKKPSRLSDATPSKAISANEVMWEFFNSL